MSSGLAGDINTTTNTKKISLLSMVKAADEYNLMTNIYKDFRIESALIKLTPVSFGSITYNTNSSCSCAIMEILATIESLDYG